MFSEVLNHPFGVLLPVLLGAAGIGAAIWSSASSRNANRALRITWLGLAAAAAGVASWTAAYSAIAMHTPALAMGFDPVIVAFDLLLLVSGFAVAFATASYSNGLDGLAAGGLMAGLTMAGGQYLALIGLTPTGHVGWSQIHVELSVVATIAAAVLAFIVLGRSTRILRTAGSLFLMTVAVFAIQRLALGAIIVTPGEAHALHPADLTPSTLQILVAGFYGLTAFLVTGSAILHVKSKTGALAQLRDAIEAMPAGLAFYDKDDRLVMWNKQYAAVSGAAREHLAPGRSFRELLAQDLKGGNYLAAKGREEDWLDERMKLRELGTGAQEQSLEDGRWLRVEDRRTAEGGVVSICTDITELRAREDSFRLLFAGNPVAMCIMRHGTLEFIDANQAAADLYGFSREELLTKSVFEMMAPEERDVLTEVMAQGARGEYQGEKIWKQVRADGSEIHVLPYGRAIAYGEGTAFRAA
jgi:PAS domain S-box-containing protein